MICQLRDADDFKLLWNSSHVCVLFYSFHSIHFPSLPLHSSTSLATGAQHYHLNTKEKSKEKEKKVNYFSKNVDILGLTAISQNLPENGSISPSNSYFGNSLINVSRWYKSLTCREVVLMGGAKPRFN